MNFGVDVSRNVAKYRVDLLPSLDEYLNYLLNQERENSILRDECIGTSRSKVSEHKETQTDLTIAAPIQRQRGGILVERATRKEHEEDAVSLISFETCKSTHQKFYWDIHIKDEKLLYESNFFTFLNLTWRLVFILDENGKHQIKLVCVTNDASMVEPIVITQSLPKTEVGCAGCNVNKQFIIDFASHDSINSYIENEKLKISFALSS